MTSSPSSGIVKLLSLFVVNENGSGVPFSITVSEPLRRENEERAILRGISLMDSLFPLDVMWHWIAAPRGMSSSAFGRAITFGYFPWTIF